MKKTKTLLSMVTVASSVLLAGAFVSYREGAFGALIANSARHNEFGSAESNWNSGSDEKPRRSMISSSKSGVFSNPIPESSDAQPPAKSQQAASKTSERTIMSGTKSFESTGFIRGLTPADPPPSDSEPSKPSK